MIHTCTLKYIIKLIFNFLSFHTFKYSFSFQFHCRNLFHSQSDIGGDIDKPTPVCSVCTLDQQQQYQQHINKNNKNNLISAPAATKEAEVEMK